ncbi:shikimate kinase [Chelativorans sp. Marseille-P2723]|uniref:shikimate kinase n=1 Tax=Chelativorans sp. Marseille-P2723 TaxID=2709133 RepID=UPI00156E3706|nr:shikimate kinase [Chelativorans sp. Marseille-P2723]
MTAEKPDKIGAPVEASAIVRELRRRSIVFVGLMGAGKTVIGRRVAAALDLPFIDSDHEIERVSRMTIPELFATYGEEEFRALERRVIARLLRAGPQVLSTGGGAFMNEATRRAVARHGISVWLSADLDTLMARVAKRQDRPLLNTDNPRAVMQQLMDTRYPIYMQADIEVRTWDESKEVIAGAVLESLEKFLRKEEGRRKSI